MEKQKNIFDPVMIIYIILIISIVGAVFYLIVQPKEEKIACTEEALICSDGSSVGRTGDNCEFETCPILSEAEQERNNYYQNNLAIILNLKNIENGKPDSIPSEYILLSSIPFHFSSTEFINTYFGCSLSDCTNVGLGTELIITKYNSADQSSINIGKIHPVTGSNSGGLFVPKYLTSDNQKIILDSWMGSPGAGGGNIDYGFAVINIPSQESNEIIPITSSSNFIATRSAIFYDNYNKVVYVDEGDNSPKFPKPGPSNNGKIIYKDLINNVERTVLEENLSAYDIKEVNNDILSFEATHYLIPNNCEAINDSNEWLGTECVSKIVMIRNINL